MIPCNYKQVFHIVRVQMTPTAVYDGNEQQWADNESEITAYNKH